MRDRTLKELIPEGYKLERFVSHQPARKVGGEGYEMVYKPYIVVSRVIEGVDMEWEVDLTEGEVQTIMQLFTNQPTTGETR